jgi:hypothetical protein
MTKHRKNPLKKNKERNLQEQLLQRSSNDCRQNLDLSPFAWEIDREYYHQQKKLHFFCEYTLSVLRKIESENITWEQLAARKNTHTIRIGSVGDKYRKMFTRVCSNNKIDPSLFYQIPGKASGAHPIVGYRKEGVFYLVMDDEEHGMFP